MFNFLVRGEILDIDGTEECHPAKVLLIEASGIVEKIIVPDDATAPGHEVLLPGRAVKVVGEFRHLSKLRGAVLIARKVELIGPLH